VSKSKICVGFGPHEGKCSNPAGSPWSKLWCRRCDEIRVETIGRKLLAIKEAMEPERGDPRKGGTA
jgi:hypothetical protein